MDRKIYIVIIIILVFVLIFSIFKNIGYPIIWGDEADTVMYAERILDYGYPKVHDGHNSLNYNMISGNVGVNEKYDAWTVSMWGQYYFAAPVAKLARNYENMYTKTAILRFPFALVGLIGILILPLALTPTLKKNNLYLLWITYIILSILSVSVILHIKEVRSYALSIFLSSSFLILFINFYFNKKIKRITYIILSSLVLFLLVNFFPPGYLAISFSVGFYVFVSNIYKFNKLGFYSVIKTTLLETLPIILAGLCIFPILIFFKTSSVSGRAYFDMGFGINVYIGYLSRIFIFLMRYHFLTLFFFLLGFLMLMVKETGIRKYLVKNKLLTFLIFVFFSYIPAIAFTPYMFDRYFVFLQPLLNLIISFLIILILENLSLVKDINKKSSLKMLFIYSCILVFGINIILKSEIYTGRIYELTHKYYGPMDYTIEYIKSNYPDPKKLVILTNAEQPVLMYYLGSHVICDEQTDCNYEAPDIIFPRHGWGYLEKKFTDVASKAVENNKYKQILLPIWDYPSNNIPELSLGLRHLFKTPITNNDDQKILLLVKETK